LVLLEADQGSSILELQDDEQKQICV